MLFGQLGALVPAPGETAETPAPNRPVESVLETQVELHRRGFSCGSIDGALGTQTAAALAAFQRGAGIRETGVLDDATRARLTLTTPALDAYTLTPSDLASLHPVPDTWLEKSALPVLGYASALELVAERYHANPSLIRKLNPSIDWKGILLGAKLVVPAVDRVSVSGTATQLVLSLSAHQLEVIDENSRVMAHFPVSIARMAEKRPVGKLEVTVVIIHPNYTFDPELFPESAEGRSLDRRLTIPPGPNNPVGLVWIGLDLPGYGIHGTPEPENVGRTESHGCFRLANWDALTLANFVKVGMPVLVE
ncbi:MAG: murein L,D-transpeptidase [Verrucomicrobia bacterium]|nr:murein L,D-transpeptidase [Verrucomicrobiota bacterium]